MTILLWAHWLTYHYDNLSKRFSTIALCFMPLNDSDLIIAFDTRMTVSAAGAFTYRVQSKVSNIENISIYNLTKIRGPKHKKMNRCERHTQTRPLSPTAISNDSFFPRASRTGHVGELNNLLANNIKIYQNKCYSFNGGQYVYPHIRDMPVDVSNT